MDDLLDRPLPASAGGRGWDDWAELAEDSVGKADGMPAEGTVVQAPGTPVLHLDGFDGPMDLLLDLAERQRIDLGRMSILALAEQFVAALARLGDRVPIERRADWLVMATRLVLLRSRLLFPESPMAAEAAQRDAAAELRRIDELARMREVAAWLDSRPVLGRDVFARGQPERLGTSVEAQYAIDVVAFLWASLELFGDGGPDEDTQAVYRPSWQDLHAVPDARDRILRRLAEHPGPQSLDRFLPQERGVTGREAPSLLRRRSAWTSVFAASLELAKQGEVTLAQEGMFTPIHLSPPSAACAQPPGPTKRTPQPRRGGPSGDFSRPRGGASGNGTRQGRS